MNARRLPRAGLRCLVPGLSLSLAVALSGCSDGAVDQALRELTASDPLIRRQAAQQLADSAGEDARIPLRLVGALDDVDPEVRRWSCRGLQQAADQSAAAPLERRLGDHDVAVRRAAAFALIRIAPTNQRARQELDQAMRAGDGGVIVALTKWTPPPTWAVETAIALLKEQRPGMRRLAAEALGAWGAGSGPAAAALRRAETDADEEVRAAAKRAREQLGG